MTAEDDDPPPSRRGALVAFAVIAIAVLAMIYVVQRLHQASAIQDCVMAGRTNCVRIEAPAR
ncbi:MAG TPA: hypothetical protein VFW75_05885 [Acetobacteraceae bacterium]|nr:hypothetical protein [Acetobacteraceae bacterium]